MFDTLYAKVPFRHIKLIILLRMKSQIEKELLGLNLMLGHVKDICLLLIKGQIYEKLFIIFNDW